MHPLCERCEKRRRISLATQLDHIVPLEHGGPDFDADEGTNRQGLCDACHLDKTAEDRGYKPSGGDARGMPTDPRHPWNRPK